MHPPRRIEWEKIYNWSPYCIHNPPIGDNDLPDEVDPGNNTIKQTRQRYDAPESPEGDPNFYENVSRINCLKLLDAGLCARRKQQKYTNSNI